MEENPETKLIKRLKSSENYIEKLIGSNIERVSDLEKETDAFDTYFDEQLDNQRDHFYELLDLHEQAIDALLDRIKKLEDKLNDQS